MTDLNALAEKIRTATPDQQADMLNDAWDALGPISKWTAEQAGKFGRCIDAEAFESAGLMLLPTDGSMSLTEVQFSWEPARRAYWPAIVVRWYPPFKKGADWHAEICSAATLGLTFAVAALKARARAMEGA